MGLTVDPGCLTDESPPAVTYDKGGRIIRMSRAALDDFGASYDSQGPPRFGARRLHWGERLTSADPGTRLSSAIVDGGEGVGISFPLTGAWGSADWTGAYPYGTFSLDDVYGAPLGGAIVVAIQLTVYGRGTLPGPTDEWQIGMALVNEADLTTGTVDGMGCGIGGAGAVNNSATRFNCANGAGTEALSATSASVAGASGITAYNGIGATAALRMIPYSLTSAGVIIAAVAEGGVASFGNPARLYLAVFAGRTNVSGVNAIAPAADFYVSPILRSPLLTATP